MKRVIASKSANCTKISHSTAIGTASFSRSSKNMKCRFSPLTDCQNAKVKAVFEIYYVRLNATVRLLHRWSSGWNVPLFDQTWHQPCNVTILAVVNMLLQLPPDPVVYRVEVRTAGWADLKWWLLVFHGLTVAQFHMPYGQELYPVSKCHCRTSDHSN